MERRERQGKDWMMAEADRIWNDARKGLTPEEIEGIRRSQGRHPAWWTSEPQDMPPITSKWLQSVWLSITRDIDQAIWGTTDGEVHQVPQGYDPIAEAERILYYEGE